MSKFPKRSLFSALNLIIGFACIGILLLFWTPVIGNWDTLWTQNIVEFNLTPPLLLLVFLIFLGILLTKIFKVTLKNQLETHNQYNGEDEREFLLRLQKNQLVSDVCDSSIIALSICVLVTANFLLPSYFVSILLIAIFMIKEVIRLFLDFLWK